MAQKTKSLTIKSKLSNWLITAPVKFSLLSVALVAGVTLAYALITSIATGGRAPMPAWPLAIVAGGAMIFSIWKLTKWLRGENLDRKSFVAIHNGCSLICLAALLLSAILIAGGPQIAVRRAMWLQFYHPFWLIAIAVAASLACMYVLGIFIANIYAAYRRALAMNVPKCKALLTIPFTTDLLRMPGYLLPDESKAKPAVEIKTKWYSKFTGWVVKGPANAVLVFLLTLAVFCRDIYTAGITLFFIAVFGAWLSIAGVKNFRKKIGGAYSATAAALNIAVAVLIILAIGLAARNAGAPDAVYEEIQITEIAE
jgi:hypothetical protein